MHSAKPILRMCCIWCAFSSICLARTPDSPSQRRGAHRSSANESPLCRSSLGSLARSFISHLDLGASKSVCPRPDLLIYSDRSGSRTAFDRSSNSILDPGITSRIPLPASFTRTTRLKQLCNTSIGIANPLMTKSEKNKGVDPTILNRHAAVSSISRGRETLRRSCALPWPGS